MASAETPEQVIQRITSLLEGAEVPYMLTGSFASGFYGSPRASQDIDIVIAPKLGTLKRFLKLLPEDKYYFDLDAALDAYGAEALFNVVDFETGWKVDLIVRKSRPFSLAEFDRKTRAEFAGAPIFVASAEDVLISKLEWAKLSESERQLEDAAGILRMQGQALDITYVEGWVRELGLETQWEAAKAKRS
jgi:hypothetical protein